MSSTMNREIYMSKTPDTLDLAERAVLALQGVANTSDPEDDGLFWFGLHWNDNPPYLEHSGCDIECGPKTLENYFQLRHASGCDKYREREEQLLEFLISCVEDDGMYWVRYTPKRPWHLGAYASSSHSGYSGHLVDMAIPATSGNLMAVLAIRNTMPEEKGRYDEILQRMARGLEKVAILRDDYAYFPDCKVGHPFCMPRGGWPDTKEPADEHETGEGTVVAYFGYPILGLCKWAAQSGDKQALELAGRFARFGMKKKFWGHPGDPDKMAGWEHGHVDSHFHARGIFLRGLLEYGLLSRDRNAIDFVRSSYEHIRNWGINRIGFIPTWVNSKRLTMETCFFADLLWMAVKLSDAGIGDYWEDADRIIRNHLAEAQILDRSILDKIQELTPEQAAQFSEDDPTIPITSRAVNITGEELLREMSDGANKFSRDNVLERCVGTFMSYLLPASALNSRTMSCCEANGCRALYYSWESITGYKDGCGQINLLLNRAAPWLDIKSCLPYEGRVEILNKTCERISVRIPAWVKPDEMELIVNGRKNKLVIAGHYVMVEGLKPKDVLRLEFPVSTEVFERTAHAKTEEETLYTVVVRGNTVIDISPRDPDPMHYPFYRRESFKQTATPVREVERSVALDIPVW